MTQPYFCIFGIFEQDLSFYLRISEFPFTQGWPVSRLIDIELLVLQKKSFKDVLPYKHMKFFPLLWPLPTSGDHDFNEPESALCQVTFM
jgi:hypothetical protein